MNTRLTTEEIERYLDQQDELEMEEIRMREWKKFADREEYLNSIGMESYDERRDEQFDE